MSILNINIRNSRIILFRKTLTRGNLIFCMYKNARNVSFVLIAKTSTYQNLDWFVQGFVMRQVSF